MSPSKAGTLMARRRELAETPAQERAIEFICDAVREKGYSCEVVGRPRDEREGARIRVSMNNKDWREVGVTPEGRPIVVSMGGGYYGRESDRFVRVVNGAIKKAKRL